MNRLSYLAQTLPVNIAENSDYSEVEFVVLNYNSKDEMDEWISSNMAAHIQSGLLKYYKTNEPEYFSLAHSKNMVTKLASGDIICNIDADNFAGPGYVHWVAEVFERNGPDTVITTIRKDAIPYRDQGGKLCFSKALFSAVNGYDESLIGYGMDDVDLANRLENAGGKRFFIEEEKFLQFIGHSDLERIVHYKYPGNLENIFACVSDAFEDRQRVLYLFNDNSAAELLYKFNEDKKDNLVTTFIGWTVDQEGHRKASFHRTANQLELTFLDSRVDTYREKDGFLDALGVAIGSTWKEITSKDNMYLMLLMGYNECLNRLTSQENERSHMAVNKKGWGRGTVYLNFNHLQAHPVV
jgi:hypothetical protein